MMRFLSNLLGLNATTRKNTPKTTPTRKHSTRLDVENLEVRDLMAAGPLAAATNLYIDTRHT